jgi:hypothetical protein
MTRKDALMQALNDYEELNQIVANHKGTFEELCTQLMGYNLEERLFDCDYNSITTTVILNDNNHFELCLTLDIWDDVSGNMLEECMYIESLINEVKEYGN